MVITLRVRFFFIVIIRFRFSICVFIGWVLYLCLYELSPHAEDVAVNIKLRDSNKLRVIQEVHLFTRTWIQKSFGRKYADAIRILYGGSVKHEASKTLMNQLDIDGLLVGGASLNSDSFGDIIKSLD